MLIAREALRSDADGDFVWRVADGRVERRGVEITGDRSRDRVLVTKGLVSGDTVVRSSATELHAGQKIKTK